MCLCVCAPAYMNPRPLALEYLYVLRLRCQSRIYTRRTQNTHIQHYIYANTYRVRRNARTQPSNVHNTHIRVRPLAWRKHIDRFLFRCTLHTGTGISLNQKLFCRCRSAFIAKKKRIKNGEEFLTDPKFVVAVCSQQFNKRQMWQRAFNKNHLHLLRYPAGKRMENHVSELKRTYSMWKRSELLENMKINSTMHARIIHNHSSQA